MKTKRNYFKTVLLCALATLSSTVHAQTTAFTYQGQLNTDAGNANGLYDLRFSLYDANVAGNFISGPVTNGSVAVSNGLFTVTLDFGAGVFTGTNYWVEIGVRTNGGGAFAMLVPRQQLTPTPYAIYAPQAGSALSLPAPQMNALCPPGSIIAYMGTTAPAGWLLCDGSLVSRTTYAALYAVVGNSSGSGDSSTTFKLPDFRGMFLRGVNGVMNRDPDSTSRFAPASGGNSGNTVGSYQLDDFRSHNHAFQLNNDPALTFASGTHSPRTPESTGLFTTVQTQNAGGNETRPINAYVNYIIKY